MKKRLVIMMVVFAIVLLSGCSILGVSVSNGIVPFLLPTHGTEIMKDGTITLSTSIEDNKFSFVVLQLFSDSPLTHIMNITSATEGKQSGVYQHEQETGEYVIMLKANSNKQDEGVSMKVYLEKGQSYIYTFKIKSFSPKEVVITDFAFGMK